MQCYILVAHSMPLIYIYGRCMDRVQYYTVSITTTGTSFTTQPYRLAIGKNI